MVYVAAVCVVISMRVHNSLMYVVYLSDCKSGVYSWVCYHLACMCLVCRSCNYPVHILNTSGKFFCNCTACMNLASESKLHKKPLYVQFMETASLAVTQSYA